jgi:hypothetical protein
MFRDFDASGSRLPQKPQWNMSPSRCAWEYLDPMLCPARKGYDSSYRIDQTLLNLRARRKLFEVSKTTG